MSRASSLLVDMGNSRLKWSLLQGDEMTCPQSFVHRGVPLDATLAREWSGMAPTSSVWIASVAGPELTSEIVGWVKDRWSIDAHVVKAQRRCLGVTNVYAEPGRLGIDRWLAMIAALRLSDGDSCVVVDCGTAITIDGLCNTGAHLGGLILPGLRLMRDALLAGTRIGELQPEGVEGLFAADTAAAIGCGGLQACGALVDRYWEGVRERCTTSTVVLITGGDGLSLLPILRSPAKLIPDLVLKGLMLLANNPCSHDP